MEYEKFIQFLDEKITKFTNQHNFLNKYETKTSDF